MADVGLFVLIVVVGLVLWFRPDPQSVRNLEHILELHKEVIKVRARLDAMSRPSSPTAPRGSSRSRRTDSTSSDTRTEA